MRTKKVVYQAPIFVNARSVIIVYNTPSLVSITDNSLKEWTKIQDDGNHPAILGFICHVYKIDVSQNNTDN